MASSRTDPGTFCLLVQRRNVSLPRAPLFIKLFIKFSNVKETGKWEKEKYLYEIQRNLDYITSRFPLCNIHPLPKVGRSVR